MRSKDATPEPAFGELSRVARASLAARRERLDRARHVILQLLHEPANRRAGVDLRRVAFEKHRVDSQDTSAALRALERDGVIAMAPDFSYRPARSARVSQKGT